MTFPRLTEDPSKVAFRSMLKKAREDSLSPEAQRRIEAALHAAPILVPRATGLRSLFAKGVLALSALVVVGVVVTHRTPPAPSVVPAPPAPSIPAAPVPTAEEQPTFSVHDLPEAPVVPAPSHAPVVEDDRLGREAALLRAVREDIAAGRGDDALTKLDGYDRSFHGTGAMGEEAAVERVEALRETGDVERARALASKLLAERPDGPFARKLRALQ